ncbi:hypothetical protein ALC57_03753 [Trachymyrmex cornetzi]|uniref:Uncharacterized protein n=1 Tax=Trachymyrmex cornetzi TaxID=471704 RepID=A0A151JMB7_9HYME|nr:hypothetical protein ALC57_03753 [Trachymyrmex cornetzi]
MAVCYIGDAGLQPLTRRGTARLPTTFRGLPPPTSGVPLRVAPNSPVCGMSQPAARSTQHTGRSAVRGHPLVTFPDCIRTCLNTDPITHGPDCARPDCTRTCLNADPIAHGPIAHGPYCAWTRLQTDPIAHEQ